MARPATSASGLFTGRPATAAISFLGGWREPARCVATGNINITAGGLLVIDSVQTLAGDRVLLAGQADAKENGIYIAAAGPWYRAPDARQGRAITKSIQVRVQEGATKAFTTWEFTTLNPVLGSDAIALAQTFGGGGATGFGILRMLTIGGTANAITATFVPALTSRNAGQMLRLRPTLANTGAMTLAADGLAAAAIKMPDGSDVPAGAVQANTDYLLEDDGVNYVIRFSNITF